MTERKPKKSETIEFRLAYGTKKALMARCEQQGQTTSETLRQLIERELASQQPMTTRRMPTLKAVILALLGGLALGAVAAPSLALQTNSRAQFEQMDTNADGQLSFEEYRSR